ncbi:MAG: polysaccharide pyruvyl transferase family protein [bacterium]|nr:polysaccharide pyruvyl transferase family protein [bacterium]
MTRILMRAGMSPLDNKGHEEVLLNNLFWRNIGNMLFPYSIMRLIMREDTQVDTIRTNIEYPPEVIDEWNATYDYFVIPLANAFRHSFRKELKRLAELVKQLNMPCIVACVGVQAGVDGPSSNEEAFDEEAKLFMDAILEKSACVGVRGEFTAEFLKKLGYVEEKHFTVVGCPAMYSHGFDLPLRMPGEITPQSKVSVNGKIDIPQKLVNFIFESAEKFEDYKYLPQGIDDLLLLYAGTSVSKKAYPNMKKGYPWRLQDKICSTGHELGFTDARSWLKFLSTRDISFGTRIHGNIAAVQAGTPAFIFAPDGRILELARYHNIQHMMARDLPKEADIFDILSRADFGKVLEGHAMRFQHYLDFLDLNGLPHIYQKDENYGKSVFDEHMRKLPYHGPIVAWNTCEPEEQIERLQNFYKSVRGTVESPENYLRRLSGKNRNDIIMKA